MNHQAERDDYGPLRMPAKSAVAGWHYPDTQQEFDRRLLTQYVPAAVLINEDMEIIHTRGYVNRYLTLATGRASLSILNMVPEGLSLALRNAIHRTKKEKAVIRKQNIEVNRADAGGERGGSRASLLDFEVVPLSLGDLKELYFMILFRDSSAEPSGPKRRLKFPKDSRLTKSRINKLAQELAATKEYLQSVIETHEATNEELQAANEEILSSNEELQSTNEELETAKEELQSANEELSTVNDELRSRNSEVTLVNADLTNLLSSIDIAVVMVNRDFTIRRFTPRAQEMLGLIPGDAGRPLININPTLEIPDFQQLVVQVMSNSRAVEKEVSVRGKVRYQMRILPYRMLDGSVDGAVITLVDVSQQTADATKA